MATPQEVIKILPHINQFKQIINKEEKKFEIRPYCPNSFHWALAHLSQTNSKYGLGPFQQIKNPAKTFWPLGPVKKLLKGPGPFLKKRIMKGIHKGIHTVYSIYLTHLGPLEPCTYSNTYFPLFFPVFPHCSAYLYLHHF